MSTIPSRKGSSNADAKGSKTTSANSSRNRTFKKASSSSTLGSRTDSKLSQTSLSAFFAKVRPQDPSDEATFPASAPTPTISRQPSPFQSLVPNRTASANVPRKVIIEVSSEDEHVDQEPRRKTLGPSKPMKRLKVDKPKGSAMAVQSNSIAESRHRRKVPDIPGFVAAARGSAPSIMDDMPVSPPDNSTVSSTRRSPIRDDVVEGSSDKHELDSKPLHEAVDNDPLLSNLATTPQRDPASPANITPQRPGGKSSPFRTPTEESRHTLSTIESLGLSPQDSVFWARTPPSEALKKLERMNSGRSHEDEIASIVGRLYETSSAGAALRTMPQEPRDRIKEMLETIRGSSMTSRLILEDGQDDLDDTDELDPASPTKSLVERHRGISQNRRGLSRHFSAQELRTTGRRRGYTRPSLISDSPYSSQFNGPRSREDVLKMIEQMNSNMVDSPQSDEVDATGDVGSHNTSPSVKKTKSNDATSASGGEGASHKTTCLATLDVTPKTTPRTAPPPANSSPGEFDEFFTEMDEQDLEELTQLELSSASMTSTLPCSNVLSCPSSSLETCSTLCEVQKDKSGLDLKQSLQGSKSSGASNSSSSMNLPNEGPSSSDEFDDIGDLGYDFEDDTIINELSYPVRIDSVKYRRLQVIDVQGNIIDERWKGNIKILRAREARSDNQFNVVLCESWIDSQVVAGDTIHVVGGFIEGSELTITNAQGFLIVRPDVLIPTSVLAESFTCIRKPVVDLRARKPDESTIPLTHGTMLHELFQESLRANDFSTVGMETLTNSIAKAHLNELCLVNESLDVARETLRQRIPACQEWARRYMRAEPSAESTIEDSMRSSAISEFELLCINKVLDIEENIWSPMFGLKGKIDASVQVLLGTNKRKEGSTPLQPLTLTVPFELKTGGKYNVVSHHAQTMLYTLLMTDRYDVDVKWGLLFYLKTGEFIRVQARHDEIRTILMQRNSIALHDEATLTLPPMVQSAQKCRRCFSFSSCTVLHKLLEDGTGESSGLGTMFEQATDHLTKTHAEFLRKWNRLLTMEYGDISKFQSQIWSMLSKERQASGNCFSNTVLDEEWLINNINRSDEISAGHRFAHHRYRFKITKPSVPARQQSSQQQSSQQSSQQQSSQQSSQQALLSGNSLLGSNISVGDPIVVSSESQHYALAIGQVIDMTLNDITVGLDRPLLGPPMRMDGYDTERNQSYRGVIEVDRNSLGFSPRDVNDYISHLRRNNITFRIDKDEMSAGIARTRNNLIQLFRADADGGDSKRRNLVVDLVQPAFDPLVDIQHQNPLLNDDQRRAIEAVLTARDYALILGMPGTGKTTTITQIIHMLVSRGKSVLLSSYTHSAVDNVLLKLLKLLPDNTIVRIGNKDKVHRDVQHLVPDFGQPPLNTVENIQNHYGRCQVVGTTCLGVGDPLFAEKRFDYCIVDEASQITLPVCLGPIRYADVFVLVGDHKQLPPVVKNPEARKDGFDISLFKMLADQYPESVTSLTHQYRMNKDVMFLSNELMYENQLQCGTKEVADKVLSIPDMDRFRRHSHVQSGDDDRINEQTIVCSGHSEQKPCWLEQILDPQRSVIFVDTDALPAHEVRVGSSTQNPTEALLVQQLVRALTSGGISQEDIGVISVLRAQLKVLSQLLGAWPLLDIHTVDRYQGKDKECVIVSLVRSNAERHVGELLKDWRRVNVAFTRAKKKLVVFGSKETLQESDACRRFLELMEHQEWILKLPPQAHKQHPTLKASKGPTATTDRSGEARESATPEKNRTGTLVRALNPPGRPKYMNDDEDKENRPPGSSSISTKTTKEVKVSRLRADTVLKRMPISKNILDSL